MGVDWVLIVRIWLGRWFFDGLCLIDEFLCVERSLFDEFFYKFFCGIL